jgi:hypothetical protein
LLCFASFFEHAPWCPPVRPRRGALPPPRLGTGGGRQRRLKEPPRCAEGGALRKGLEQCTRPAEPRLGPSRGAAAPLRTGRPYPRLVRRLVGAAAREGRRPAGRRSADAAHPSRIRWSRRREGGPLRAPGGGRLCVHASKGCAPQVAGGQGWLRPLRGHAQARAHSKTNLHKAPPSPGSRGGDAHGPRGASGALGDARRGGISSGHTKANII